MRSYAEARIRDEKALPEVRLSYINADWKILLIYLRMIARMLVGSAVGGGGIMGVLAFFPSVLL